MKKYTHGFWEDGKNKYSVDELFEIVSGRDPEEVSIKKIIGKNKDLETKEGNFLENLEDPTTSFRKRVEKSDTSYPILLSDQGWIIDGSHRVAKLKWQGKMKILAHIISEEDLKNVRLDINENFILKFELWKKIGMF
jgi:hypothetical protein